VKNEKKLLKLSLFACRSPILDPGLFTVKLGENLKIFFVDDLVDA
jgi:hypothetical protein